MTSEQTTTSTSSPSKSERDATVDAVNHLIQGKRHLLVRDITSAVNSLQEACRILAACYGEMADECGEAYFHYGTALLELSRKESGILGECDKGSDSEEEESEEEKDDDEDEESGDDEDGEKSSEQNDQGSANVTTKEADREMTKAGAVVDKVETNNSPNKEENKKNPTKDDSEAKSEDLDASKKADESTVPEEPSDPPASSSENETLTAASKDQLKATQSAQFSNTAGSSTCADESQPGTSQNKPVSEEDDVTTLQLSWEILELSKVIFKRQSKDNREMQLRLADVHMKLGEVAMESENYEQSIEDLLECFKIKHMLLPAGDRSIAQVYYELGLAYTFALLYDSAIESYKNAVQTLKDRRSNIQKIADYDGTSETDIDAAYNAKQEIEELNVLIPEIMEKIADVEHLKKDNFKLPEELNKDLVPEQFKEEIAAVDSTIGTTVSPSKIPKPVSNIAHLVRKKRKPEDDDVSASVCNAMEAKRSRPSSDELGRDNPVTDAVSTKINGTTQMECCQIVDTDKSSENSNISESNTPVSSI